MVVLSTRRSGLDGDGLGRGGRSESTYSGDDDDGFVAMVPASLETGAGEQSNDACEKGTKGTVATVVTIRGRPRDFRLCNRRLPGGDDQAMAISPVLAPVRGHSLPGPYRMLIGAEQMTTSTFQIDGMVSRTARLWRCRPWNANPLMRWPDRLLAAVRILVAVLVLVSVPVAGAVGTITYTDDAADIRAQRAGATVVTALVLQRPERTPAHLYRARVSWPGASGSSVATVTVVRKISEGDRIPVWVNASGNPIPDPRAPSAAVMSGIGAAMVILIGVGFTGLCLIFLTESLVTRLHSIAWDRHMSAP